MQPLPAAAPEPASAAAALEQCSRQEGSEAVPQPPSDSSRSPTRSPDRKRQAIACRSATDTIASGSFGVQVMPSRAQVERHLENKFAAFMEHFEYEAMRRGL